MYVVFSGFWYGAVLASCAVSLGAFPYFPFYEIVQEGLLLVLLYTKATDFINLKVFLRTVTVFDQKRKEPKGIRQIDGEGREKGPVIHSGRLVTVAMELQGCGGRHARARTLERLKC